MDSSRQIYRTLGGGGAVSNFIEVEAEGKKILEWVGGKRKKKKWNKAKKKDTQEKRTKAGKGKSSGKLSEKKIKCKRKGGRIGRRERQKKKRKIRKECEKRMKGW